ncbi:phytoene/squalene synthase family protein [Rhodobacterales bacterium]|nr:phytoene/squalene synthase family protein [Rhodobacterales bacterium]
MTVIVTVRRSPLPEAVNSQGLSAPSRGLTYGFSGHEADLKACAAAIRIGSKSFHLASLFLPSDTRRAAQALYAFCRHADDLVDDARASEAALDQLRGRLDRIYRGTPADHACDRAFARTVERCAIPKAVPLALLDGFAMDIANRRYRTIGDVKSYATCVASSVGLMMALAMRTGAPQALARAADLGIAMQLTNIARDVGEDARNGRLYLPTDWLDAAGIDADAFLREPRHSPALGDVVRRLLQEASAHYRLGHAGIAALPANCQPAIRAAALVYESIGKDIAANRYDSVSRRAHTSLGLKLKLLLRAHRPSPASHGADRSIVLTPPDPAAADLVATASATWSYGLADNPSRRIATGRFLTIMMRLQADTREEWRFRRLEAQKRANGVV